MILVLFPQGSVQAVPIYDVKEANLGVENEPLPG